MVWRPGAFPALAPTMEVTEGSAAFQGALRSVLVGSSTFRRLLGEAGIPKSYATSSKEGLEAGESLWFRCCAFVR